MSGEIVVHPKESDEALLNPGMGILLVLRGNTHVRHDQVDPNAWFMKERLTDKIEVSIPWCLLEPKEGKFDWNHHQWEGSFMSWVEKGCKVALKVRGMSTRGTLYEEGTPQWVFDAGAKYIDEEMDNFVSLPNMKKRRLPVYWDPVYLEKSCNLIKALGQRYNGKPYVEFVQNAHMGQWGEMHVSEHSPRKPWLDAGYTIERYTEAHKKLIDAYVKAFPNTQISQAIGEPLFGISTFDDIEEIISYLVEKRIMLKCGGLGYNWSPGEGGDPYVDDGAAKYFNAYYPFVKTYFENFSSLRVMKSALKYHISYWHRGCEYTGLAMPYETQNNIDVYKYMAKNIGFRFVLKEISYPSKIKPGEKFSVNFKWKNLGSAPCYKNYGVSLSLLDGNGKTVWEEAQLPETPTSSIAWNTNCVVKDRLEWTIKGVRQGEYDLLVGMRDLKDKNIRIELGLSDKDNEKRYRIGKLTIIGP